MVWCVIDVCIKNRTLHDHLEIRNFSSHIEKYFSMLEEKFHLTAWPCNIIYVFQTKCFIKQVIYFWSVPTCIQLIKDLAIVFITHLDLSLKGIPFAVVNSQAAKFTGEFFWRGRGYIWLQDFGGFWFYLHYYFNLYFYSRYQISPRFTLRSWPRKIWDTGSRLPVLVHSCHLESEGIPPGN